MLHKLFFVGFCAMCSSGRKCIFDRLICFGFHFLRIRPADRPVSRPAGHKSSWLQSRIHRPPRPTRSIRRYVMRPIARAIVGGPRTDSPAAAAANRLWGPPRGNLICRPVVEGVEVAGQYLMLSSFLRSLSAKVV